MAEVKPLKAGATGAEQLTSSDTIPAVNLPVMVGDSGSGGTKGAVPAPASGDASKFLRGDATWATAGGGSSPNVISPSQITSDQDDYAPTGWADATVVRLNFDASGRAITGFDPETDGEEKTLVNTTAYFAYIPSEHPDSTAAYRVAGYADHVIAPYGSIRIIYDDTTDRWRVTNNTFSAANLTYDAKGVYYEVNAASTNQSDHPYLGLTQAGTGSGNAIDAPTTSLFSTWTLSTGTTTTGSALIYLLKNANALAAYGGGHLCGWGAFNVPTLSDGTNTYTVQIALTGSPNSTTLTQNNTIGLRYSSGINSGKIEAFTRDNAGTESTADTGITVATSTLYFCKVWIDKGRTEARYTVLTGTTVYTGRIAANLPNAVICGMRCIIAKTAGTANRNCGFAQIGAFAIY